MKLNWNGLWKALRSVIGWWILGIITLIVILNGYTVSWTGFGDYTTPTGEFVQGKTLWDWMELLIIPIFLWAGAVAVNRSERNLERQRAEDRAILEREIATDRQQEAALQAYIDRMSELLLKEKLRTTKKAEVRDVARTRTISVMRGLDKRRKQLVIQFLREANLINTSKSILNGANMADMNLEGLDLRDIYLQDAKLSGVDLRKAYLGGANFQRTKLDGANLQDAVLVDTNFQDASLIESDLRGALLMRANLQHVNLWLANLQKAELRSANLRDAYISNVNLEGASMVNVNLEGASMIEVNLEGADLQLAKVTEEQLTRARLLASAILDDIIHE